LSRRSAKHEAGFRIFDPPTRGETADQVLAEVATTVHAAMQAIIAAC
jgi:hypothetical protein